MNGLTVSGVSKRFGATQALADVDLEVGPGEVVALLGENGAGKSTISNIIAGSFGADAGTMTWLGRPYAPAMPAEAIDSGIGMIHQELLLLGDLTVAENVFVGRWPERRGAVDRVECNRRAAQQLERLGADIDPERKVRTLSIAAQQEVEIAKALTLDAKLLLLDEPTAPLGAAETEHLFSVVQQLRGEGVSFIYVSHRLDEIARIADRVIVLRDGKVVATHDDAEVPVKQLIAEMVGRTVERLFPPISRVVGDELLKVEGLCSHDGAFTDISFSVRAGEVLGIAGVVGAGRTELVRAIAGADPVASGTVSVGGAPIELADPARAIAAGIALVPEDRKSQGAVLGLSIEANIALANLDRLSYRGWVSPASVRELATDAIDRVGVKGSPDQAIAALSGGNQQKVVIAKWLARRPRVIVLDEPTRGIDMGARAAIYEVISELARAGMAVIVVSSELEEVLGLSHRVLVLSRGRQRGLLDREQVSDRTVMELATT